MKIKVRYFASLREAIGHSQEDFESSETSCWQRAVSIYAWSAIIQSEWLSTKSWSLKMPSWWTRLNLPFSRL
jgi:hypothetical protein